MKSKDFPYKNSKVYQRKLLNIAYSAVGIPMLFFFWLFLELIHGDMSAQVSKSIEYIVIFFTILSVFLLIWMGRKIFRSGMSLAREENLLKEKLIIYQKVAERKFLLLFIASVITTIGLFLCANELFGAIYALLIIIFSLSNPTRDRISNDLQLRDRDKKKVITGEDFNFDY